MTDVLEGGPLGRREPELAGKRENKNALVVEGATLAVPKVEKARTVAVHLWRDSLPRAEDADRGLGGLLALTGLCARTRHEVSLTMN